MNRLLFVNFYSEKDSYPPYVSERPLEINHMMGYTPLMYWDTWEDNSYSEI